MKDNLQFLSELPIYQQEQPYQLFGFANQDSIASENCEFEAKDIEVADARECKVSIADHGFTFARFRSACPLAAKHFETVGGDKTVVMDYLRETIDFARTMFKPLDIVCYDWRVSSCFFQTIRSMRNQNADGSTNTILLLLVPQTRSKDYTGNSPSRPPGHSQLCPAQRRCGSLR